MNERTLLTWVRASAVYDLVVTLPFATPWTAATMLAALGRFHEALHLSGAPPPEMAPLHLLFTAFFGTVVTSWSVLRVWRPRVEHALADGLTRVAFSAWQMVALAQGQSRLLLLFLVFELAFGVMQLSGWARVRARWAAPHEA
jgi:hypothetical protein